MNDEIICDKCGKSYDIFIQRKINTKENPSVIQEITDDTFFKRKCPHCENIMYISHDLILEYEQKKTMFICAPDKLTYNSLLNMLQNDSSFRVLTDRYKNIRIVDSPDFLREKVRIMEMNRDDRIIELIKLMFLNELNEKKMIKSVQDVLCWVENDGNMIFDFFGERNGELKVESALYALFKLKYNSFLPDKANVTPIVDINWAMDFMDLVEAQ